MSTLDRACIGTMLIGLLIVGVALGFRIDKLQSDLRVADTAHGILVKELQDSKDRVAELEKKVDGFIKEYEAVASWYGPGFHGRRAADGSIYNQYAYTIAHRTLPFGTIVIVEYKGKRVPAVVTDRGPFIKGRDFDLSLGMAEKLGMVAVGVAAVKIIEVNLK